MRELNAELECKFLFFDKKFSQFSADKFSEMKTYKGGHYNIKIYITYLIIVTYMNQIENMHRLINSKKKKIQKLQFLSN